MTDYIVPVNQEALSRALVAVAGEEMAALIVKAYHAIDGGMAFAYGRSQEEEAEKRKQMAEEYVAALQRADGGDAAQAFKEGYDAGYEAGYDADTDDQYDALFTDEYYDDDGYSDYGTVHCECPECVAERDSGDVEQPDLSGCAGFWDDRYVG